MNMKITKMDPAIYHIHFDDQIDMSTSFMRLQDFYEGVYFRNKYFQWADYVEWHVRHYKRPFDYLTAYGGFNAPGNYVREFYQEFSCAGLTDKEDELFKKLRKAGINLETDVNYYLICTCGNIENLQGYMAHELAHAYFYLIPEYKRAMLRVVKKYKLIAFRKALLKDYNKSVVNDEIHAYTLTGLEAYYSGRICDLPKQLRDLRKELKSTQKQLIKQGVVPCLK